MLYIKNMKMMLTKLSKRIEIEMLMDKIFVYDGRHHYQMDASYHDRLIAKLLDRGYRSVINT